MGSCPGGIANLAIAASRLGLRTSLAAPGWGDLSDWLSRVKAQAAGGSRAASVLLHSYQFLEEALPKGPSHAVRRATATIARLSDA